MPRPLIVGAAVALLGLLALGAGYGPADCGRGLGWIIDEIRWLPPGAAECHRHPAPATVEQRTVLPWTEWLTVMLVAACAGLFAAALRARDGRLVKAAGIYVLCLAVVFGWFFGEPLVWAVLTAAVAAAVVAARGWGVRRSAAPR